MKDKKITIGLFNDAYYPMVDGVISVVDNYARKLMKFANVIVFVPEIPNKKFDDSTLPYKVVRCKSFNMHVIDYSCPTPDLDKQFMKELNNYKLDIVHIHSPFFLGKAAIKYAKKHNIPVIATMHSQFKRDLKRAFKVNSVATLLNNIIIKTFNKCDECWAVNSEVARIFHEDYHYKTMPRVMNNATEMLPVKDEKKAKELINKKHNIDKNERVFLFVGRINNLKNVFFIANSLKILKDKNPNFKFKMLFVGTGQDETKLKDIIKKNKMQKDIIMCGKVTDRDMLSNYFCRADLFLFPSLYDASSIVQIEAASQKTPALFVEGAATAATITDNVNGFIGKNNEEEYANKIMEIMNDKELYTKVCDNAFKDLYISWDDQIKNVYDLYIKHIKDKKKH